MSNEYPEHNIDSNFVGVSNTSNTTTDMNNNVTPPTPDKSNSPKIAKKDEEIDLIEMIQNLSSVLVGFGWDAPKTTGENQEFDIDVSAFLLGSDGKVRYDTDFIFYNNLSTENGVIKHSGDNNNKEAYEKSNNEEENPQIPAELILLEGNELEQEQITIKLSDVPFDVTRIVFSITVHEAYERQQHLGLAKNMYMRLVDLNNNKEIIRYNISNDDSNKNDILICGEIVRDGVDWKFLSLEEYKEGGLYEVAHGYGVYVAPT